MISTVIGVALVEVWYVGVSCFVWCGGGEASKTRVLCLVLVGGVGETVWGVWYGGWMGWVRTRIVIGRSIGGWMGWIRTWIVIGRSIVVVIVLGRVRRGVVEVLIIVIVIIIVIVRTIRVGAVAVVAGTIRLVYFLCFACHVFDVFTFPVVFFLTFVVGLTELFFYVFLQRF